MDRVINKRLAVRRQRHAPDQAVERFRKPDRVYKLQQHVLAIARIGRLDIDHRLGGVDVRRTRRAAPAQPAEAVAVAADLHFEARRVGWGEPVQLALGERRVPERIELRAREQAGHHAARNRQQR